MLAWLWTRLSEGGPQVSISGRALSRFPERDVDRLLRARVLIELLKADSWSVCAHCECGLDVRPIREIGDELRACCPHDSAEDVVLDEKDLERFSIDPGGLAAQIAASGGLSGAPTRITDGLWSLGATPAGVVVMLCSDAAMFDAPGTILAVRAAADPRPASIIIYEPSEAVTLRLREAGVQLLPFASVFLTGTDGRDRLVIERASASDSRLRLVVRRSAQTAILDGHTLDLPIQRFVLLRMLAEQLAERDPVLLAQTIERALGREPRGIARDLRASLVANGLRKTEAEALIMLVRNRGYRLGLDAAEVVIED